MMLEFLDKKSIGRLRLLFYLDAHASVPLLQANVMEELKMNRYELESCIKDVQADVKEFDLADQFVIETGVKPKTVKYTRKTFANISCLISCYASQSKLTPLIKAVLMEQVENTFDLEDVLYASRATVYKIMAKANELLEIFEIEISSSCQFVGKERDIQSFLYGYYYTLYGVNAYPFTDSMKDELVDIIHQLSSITHFLDDDLSNSQQVKLLYRLFVLKVRNHFGHHGEKIVSTCQKKELVQNITEVLNPYFQNLQESEVYELLYFISSENLSPYCQLVQTETIEILNQKVIHSVLTEFQAITSWGVTHEVTKELSLIHNKLLFQKRTNFENSTIQQFSFIKENYQLAETLAYRIVQELLEFEWCTDTVKANYDELAKEYIFLFLSSLPIELLSPKVKIVIDFSFSQSYSRYIQEQVDAFGKLNIESYIGATEEEADIYISDMLKLHSHRHQVIWLSPPTSSDWEKLGDLIVHVKIKKSGNNDEKQTESINE